MIRRLFRKRTPKVRALPDAELARRLIAPGYRCACCGEVLDAPNAIRMRAPFGWPDPPPPEPDDAIERSGDVLTDHYARRGRDMLVRANLPVPVQGTEGHVFLGIWASLSAGDFARFRSAQDRGDADRLGDLSSWLYTRLPADSGPVLSKGVLVPVESGGLPVFWITDAKHPLRDAQNTGMSAQDVVALYQGLGAEELLTHLQT